MNVNNELDTQIRGKLKELRDKAARLSAKRLTQRLDRGDKHLLLRLLDDLDTRIEYLHHLDKSTCSAVLENCGISYGPTLPWRVGV